MNGSSTRIFQNVRYDLVLNDDNPNDYYFEPTGPDVSASGLKDKMLPAKLLNEAEKKAKEEAEKKAKEEVEKEKPAAKKTKKKKRSGKKGKNKQARAIIKKSHENYLEALKEAGGDEEEAKKIFSTKQFGSNQPDQKVITKLWNEEKKKAPAKESAKFNKDLNKKLREENINQGRTSFQKISKLGKKIPSLKGVGKGVASGVKSIGNEALGSAKDQKAITYKPQLEEFEKILSDKQYPRPAKAMKQMSKLLKRGKWGLDPSVKWSKIEKEIKDMDAKELKNYLSRETSFLARRGRQAKATGTAGDKAVKNLFSGTYNAVKGAGKAANEITKQGSLGVVRSGIGAAGSKAFKGGKAIGKYAKGITTAQNNYNNVKTKSKHVEGLSEIEKLEKEQLKEKVKEIKMLEKIIFKLSGQPTATRKRLNKIGKGAAKGLKFAGKGLFKLGKKGVGFLNKIPGSKVGFGSSMRGMGKGFKMGRRGARAGMRRLKKFGGAASQGARNIGRKFRGIGKSGAKLALKGVKAASMAAAATAAAIAAKTKTPLNDEPGLVCWNCTNLPPCLILKCIAPILTCSFLTEEKARQQAKRLKR